MRPKDWEKDHPYSVGDDSFEAGADAMLEGLKKEEEYKADRDWHIRHSRDIEISSEGYQPQGK